jgi:hypothetical protein
MTSVCLADRNNLFASLEFAMAAVESKIQPIHGIILNILFSNKGFLKSILLRFCSLPKIRPVISIYYNLQVLYIPRMIDQFVIILPLPICRSTAMD